MKFALILIAIAAILILYFMIDFRLGRKKHLKVMKEVESPFFCGEFQMFSHGKELFEDYFHELKEAKSHIHVLFYILTKDPISREFLEILKKKAEEGVEVRILLDQLGSISVPRETMASAVKAGVEVAYCNKVRFPFLFYSSQVRNHRKITVIDGTIGYLGGFNIGKEYIDQHPKLSPWRDYHLKITGLSLSFLQHEFLREWKEYSRVDLLEEDRYYPKNENGHSRHRLIATEGTLLENSYFKLIRGAVKSIMIGTPYFIPSKKIFAELLEAIRRGVNLTIIVPATSDHILVKEASYRYLRRLLEEGGKVYQFKNGFYHAKTIIIDEEICDVGTANFDKRSFFLNKEINCYIHDPAFIQHVRKVVDKDLSDSRPLLLSDLSGANPFRSFKEFLAGTIAYFL